MSEVKRYQWVGVRGLTEQDNGRWVKYEDYAALKAERDALAAENSSLKVACLSLAGECAQAAGEAELTMQSIKTPATDTYLNSVRAKLAELEKQEPVHTKLKYSSVLPKFIGDTDEVESYHCVIHGNTPARKTMEEAYADAKQMCGNLFTRPAPAINLAELVPDEMPGAAYAILSDKFGDGACMISDDMWSACRAAIFRNIEEAKK